MARLEIEPRHTGYIPGTLPTELPSLGYRMWIQQYDRLPIQQDLQQQNFLFQSVLICVFLSLSIISSRKPGDIWMHIGMYTITLPYISLR